ncbi:MAG: gamma-glutamylcyclotransferase [Myxococcales bacterium]|nr:gamma-glutamylcyclotransferase [Myxococcales bacterium]
MKPPPADAAPDHDAGVTASGIPRDSVALPFPWALAFGCGPSGVRVFAYGSLISEPELPQHVQRRVVARLDGWHRTFNTRSESRGCPAAARPRRAAVPGFEIGGDRRSLVLGTAPGGHIDGMLLTYPGAVRAELLARLQRREGPGYRHTQVQVTAGDLPCTAHAWLTAPDSQRRVDLPLEAQAAILAAATPVRDVDGRARGANYLFDVVEALAAVGVEDPELQRLAAATRLAIAHAGDPGYS